MGGGANALSLYKAVNYRAPRAKPSVGKYVTKGCLTDPDAIGGCRALLGASTASSSMTNDMCVKYCLGRKFRYAG